jgi:hypothetical protein
MQPIGKPGSNNLATKPNKLHVHVDNEIKHVATTSIKKEIKFQISTIKIYGNNNYKQKTYKSHGTKE